MFTNILFGTTVLFVSSHLVHSKPIKDRPVPSNVSFEYGQSMAGTDYFTVRDGQKSQIGQFAYRWAFMHLVEVKKEHQGQGYGTLLLEEGIREMSKFTSTIFLSLEPIDGSDLKRLRKLYEEHGFRKFWWQRWDDCPIMYRTTPLRQILYCIPFVADLIVSISDF